MFDRGCSPELGLAAALYQGFLSLNQGRQSGWHGESVVKEQNWQEQLRAPSF
jgi:hypothetical protein